MRRNDASLFLARGRGRQSLVALVRIPGAPGPRLRLSPREICAQLSRKAVFARALSVVFGRFGGHARIMAEIATAANPARQMDAIATTSQFARRLRLELEYRLWQKPLTFFPNTLP